MITNFTLFCFPLFGLTWFNPSLSLLIWLTSSRLDFVHLFSTWFNRYECYDKLFLTPLILNKLTRWLWLNKAPFGSIRFVLAHSGATSFDSNWFAVTRYISFRLMSYRLMSIVVGLRSKPSLTSLQLNRFARWLVRLPSICLYIVHLEAVLFLSLSVPFASVSRPSFPCPSKLSLSVYD